jgi:hypothetical protein
VLLGDGDGTYASRRAERVGRAARLGFSWLSTENGDGSRPRRSATVRSAIGLLTGRGDAPSLPAQNLPGARHKHDDYRGQT